MLEIKVCRQNIFGSKKIGRRRLLAATKSKNNIITREKRRKKVNETFYDLIWSKTVELSATITSDNPANCIYQKLEANGIVSPKTPVELSEIYECITSALKYGIAKNNNK